jgi:hypothetical protein
MRQPATPAIKFTTETHTLPAYWAPMLVNGDASGMSDAEEREVDDWMEAHPFLGSCLDVGPEEECGHFEGLLCTVAEFTFPVL